MLAPDVRFGGFTYEDWQRVLALFEPLRPQGKPRDPDRPQGLIIAVHSAGKLRKLLHSRVGRLRLDDLAPDWPLTAEELAHRHHASWGFSLESGALEWIMEELGATAKRDDDFTTQCLSLVGLVREQIDRGRLDLWPNRLQGVPVPTAGVVEGTLDPICPRGKAMLLALFNGAELYTCIGIRRGAEGIEHIIGPDEVRPHLGLLSGDFRRDHRHVGRAVSDILGPLSLGCYAEYQTFRNLEVDPTPGSWALAVAVRDVVLYPVPPAMAVPLGLDVGRAVFTALRGVVSRMDPSGALSPTLSAIRDVAMGGRSIEDIIGFQPLELLRKLLERER